MTRTAAAEKPDAPRRRFLEGLSQAALLCDETEKILLANRLFLRQAHLEPETLADCALADVFPAALYDLASLRAHLRQVLSTRQPLQRVALAYRLLGQPERTCLFSLFPYAAAPSENVVLLLLEEVIPRKKTEAAEKSCNHSV
ncbi:MAG: PAS domain-containing protein [Gemmataceae bacterium]